jgi:hypothetical protein
MLAFSRLAALLMGCLMVGCLVSPGALAQTATQTASSWGLLGEWRRDCRSPIADDNPSYLYLVRNGQLYLDRDFAKSGTDSSVVSGIRRTAAGEIEYVIQFISLAHRQHLNAKSADGRMRVIFNKNLQTGEASVVDGKFTDGGQITPWLSRCR